MKKGNRPFSRLWYNGITKMKNLKKNFLAIIKKHRGLFWLMALLLVVSLVLLIYALVNLEPEATMVKMGYGDIGRYQGGEWTSMVNSGGYYDGVWAEMIAFPILAVIFGVLHNLIAVKLFEKKGSGVAKLFVMTSIALVFSTFLVLSRLLKEG